jgi:hypothetical protein
VKAAKSNGGENNVAAINIINVANESGDGAQRKWRRQ